MNTLTILCACVLTCCLVRSSPVYPNVPLRLLPVTDACLYMCNICFDDMGPELMECANNVCMAKEQIDLSLGFIKLGRTCKNYSKLESSVFGNDSK